MHARSRVKSAPSAHAAARASSRRPARMARASVIQRKAATVEVGQRDDPLEAQADKAAAHVMRQTTGIDGGMDGAPPVLDPAGASAQRMCGECARELTGARVQREAIATVRDAEQTTLPPLTGGRALSSDERGLFEPRFGRDFSAVRLHDNAEAQRSASGINARAYTYGANIVLGAGAAGKPNKALLAHELAHVAQQGYAPPIEDVAREDAVTADAIRPKIRRDNGDGDDDAGGDAPADAPAPGTEGTIFAWPDDRLANAIREEYLSPQWFVNTTRGLRPLEPNHPQSYAVLREKLEAIYGEEVVAGMYENEARVMALVANSEAITDGLGELGSYYLDTEQDAAYDYIYDVYEGYEWDYDKIAQRYAEYGTDALDVLEMFIGGDPEEVLDALEQNADATQAEAIEREANEAEWREIGEGMVGTHVATREIFMWWDADITLSSLLEPSYGTETMAEAVAWAAISGMACVVLKVEDRYYIYESSDQFSHDEVFEASWFDRRTAIVPVETTPTGTILVSTEGLVLTRNGERFFSGSQAESPETYAAGTEKLLQQTEDLTSDQAIALFKRATLDALLINLSVAERRLRAQLENVFPGTGFGRRADVDVDFGRRVKTDADDLRQAMTRATDLVNRSEDEDFDEDDELALLQDLETIGRIQSQNPAAAMMVKSKRDPESTDPVAEGDIEDRSASMSAGDAAWAVAKEVETRLENIRLVRQYFQTHLDATLSLAPLHDAILPRFTAMQQFDIRASIIGHQLAAVAGIFGLTAAQFLLLITGAFIGGPAGVVLAGGATAIGIYQTKESLDEAERLRAQSALDVPGGFQLTSEQDAASATRWAYIGLALTVLDVGEFASGGRLLRLLGRGAAGAARGVGGALIEGAEWARRTLGLPGEIVGNLTISGINRLRSLSTSALERFAQLSATLKRVLLGCTSPCRVDLHEIRRYLDDPARAVAASTNPLTTIDEVMAALPVEMQNNPYIRDMLTRHPSLMGFIQEAGLSADDLTGLSALDIMTRGDRTGETGYKTFRKYLTSVLPAKVGPDIAEFNRIVAAAAASGDTEIANTLKGAMFENYARLYVTDFRSAGFGRRAYTRGMIPALEASRRTSDGFISSSGELWDFKHVIGRVDSAQVRDYQRILAYEATRTPPGVTSINYLFPNREAALANRHLLSNSGFRVYYLGPSGRRVPLR